MEDLTSEKLMDINAREIVNRVFKLNEDGTLSINAMSPQDEDSIREYLRRDQSRAYWRGSETMGNQAKEARFAVSEAHTHVGVWRDLVEKAKKAAEASGESSDDVSYYDHELLALDSIESLFNKVLDVNLAESMGLRTDFYALHEPKSDKEGFQNQMAQAYNAISRGDFHEAQCVLADMIDTLESKQTYFVYRGGESQAVLSERCQNLKVALEAALERMAQSVTFGTPENREFMRGLRCIANDWLPESQSEAEDNYIRAVCKEVEKYDFVDGVPKSGPEREEFIKFCRNQFIDDVDVDNAAETWTHSPAYRGRGSAPQIVVCEIIRTSGNEAVFRAQFVTGEESSAMDQLVEKLSEVLPEITANGTEEELTGTGHEVRIASQDGTGAHSFKSYFPTSWHDDERRFTGPAWQEGEGRDAEAIFERIRAGCVVEGDEKTCGIKI